MFEIMSKMMQEWQAEVEKLRGLDITETVKALAELYLHRYNLDPSAINGGMCWDFADDLKKLFPEAETTDNYKMNGTSIEESNEGWSHGFIKLNGRYYDSEAPEGVTDWMELPCCKRCTE